MFEIHNLDCIFAMQQMEADSVDLVVTDPPYGMAFQSGRRKATPQFRKIEGDLSTDIFELALPEIFRVMRPNTHAYFFCSWHQVDKFISLTRKFFTLKNMIVWNKNVHGSGDLKGAYAPKHELILYCHKGRRELKKRIPDVIDFPKVAGGVMVHPTEKPTGLLDILINNSSNPGDTVLDPFLGGGSTAISALRLGRRVIAFEIDAEYATIAINRSEHALWGDLV